MDGNTKLGFLWPESSWVWLCSPVENWGHLLQNQCADPTGAAGSHTRGLLSQCPGPWQALPAAWPRVAPQDAGAGMWEGLGEALVTGLDPSAICLCLPTGSRGWKWGSAQAQG